MTNVPHDIRYITPEEFLDKYRDPHDPVVKKNDLVVKRRRVEDDQIVNIRIPINPVGTNDDDDVKNKLVVIMKLLQSINRFPRIPQIYGIYRFVGTNSPFCVEEYIPGIPLTTLVSHSTTYSSSLKEVQRVKILWQLIFDLLDILDALQEVGFYTPIISPENVLISNTQQYRLYLVGLDDIALTNTNEAHALMTKPSNLKTLVSDPKIKGLCSIINQLKTWLFSNPKGIILVEIDDYYSGKGDGNYNDDDISPLMVKKLLSIARKTVVRHTIDRLAATKKPISGIYVDDAEFLQNFHKSDALDAWEKI